MSKLGTIGFTITLTSSNQGEQVQIDLGPYQTVDSANNSSPGEFSVANFPIGGSAQGPVDGVPLYLILSPVAQTLGSAPAVSGEPSDVGCAISDAYPSFIPVVSSGENIYIVSLILTNAAPFNVGWI